MKQTIKCRTLEVISLLYIALNPFSAGTDFRRQNLTFNVHPRTEKIKQL